MMFFSVVYYDLLLKKGREVVIASRRRNLFLASSVLGAIFYFLSFNTNKKTMFTQKKWHKKDKKSTCLLAGLLRYDGSSTWKRAYMF